MASAATEAETGSPVVMGLLVVGNIIILVRHPPVLGSEWAGGGEKGAEPGVRAEGPELPSRSVLQALKSEQAGFRSQLCLPPAQGHTSLSPQVTRCLVSPTFHQIQAIGAYLPIFSPFLPKCSSFHILFHASHFLLLPQPIGHSTGVLVLSARFHECVALSCVAFWFLYPW